MTNETEPRALSAALSAPAFVTRGMGAALHAANRHVERWAPEAEANRVRPMRSLGFVDRLVAPWIETAQRSASMRLFNQYATSGMSQHGGGSVSWVFPRPWYQDELDWMAAARQVRATSASPSYSASSASSAQVAPTLLTTRGTYVAPAPVIETPRVAMPSALYEYVAPSLSLAAAHPAPIPGVGFGGETLARGEAYSPLVSLASVQAAELMSRAVSPLAASRSAPGTAARPMTATTAMTPGLRAVLTTILERAAAPRIAELPPSRLAMSAPHMVTPPAPSDAELAPADATSPRAQVSQASASASQVADSYAEQRSHIVELQRIAQQSAQREQIARAEIARSQAVEAAARAASPGAAPSSSAASASSSTQSASAAQAAQAQQIAAGQAAQIAAAQTAGAQATQIARAQAAQIAEAQAAQTADVRVSAERAERELRERVGAARENEAQLSAGDRARAEAAAAAAERTRVEERIAQRLAERAGGQRLHEQARAEAAAHVRTPIVATTAPVSGPIAPAAPAYRPSAEVTSAVAGLPPELAALLAPVMAQRPERAMQAILELNDTLRTVELLARSSAAGATFEATRGPRLVMPAGLGGLVNAVDRAQSITERPAALSGQRPLAPLAQFVDAPAAPQARPARDVRMPTLAWLSPAARPQATAPTTALGATETATPVALSHVAWADRWLARFAGAAPQSLDMISATAAVAPELRLQALANAAPAAVFVAPEMLRGDLEAERALARSGRGPAAQSAQFAQAAQAAQIAAAVQAAQATQTAATQTAATQTAGTPAAQVPGMRLIPPGAPSLRRFDDDAETPDDVFAAISAAAARDRAAPRTAAAATSIAAQAQAAQAQAAQAQAAQAQAAPSDRSTLADLVAHSAPSAPGAGLSAQLSSSPFAPALRHLLPVASSASFDVRSLFGAGLGATYLAGLIGPSSRELEIGAQMLPTWASWSEAPLNQQADDRADRLDRLVPSFDPAYVRPDMLDDVLGGAAPGAAGVTGATGASAEQLRQVEQLRQLEQLRASGDASPASTAAIVAAIERGSLPATSLTTLRTALLSWDLTTTAGDAAAGVAPTAQLMPGSFATASTSAQPGYRESAYAQSAARTMIEAMSMPMLGDLEQPQAPAWGGPGMVADRAHAWSVAQERSASDLALDFVTPELVLAARVYGLGPAEAAQAARLAIVGPGQLGAMASTVDRTFVEAMAIGRDARNQEAERARRTAVGSSAGVSGVFGTQDLGAPRSVPAMPVLAGVAGPAGVTGPAGVAGDERAAITTAFPTADGRIAAALAPTTLAASPPPASSSSFGVDRRAPRGAFLWPAATVAALGLNATGSDGQLSMSVAALEMLAAQVVVELGTYTALSEADATARGRGVLSTAAGAAGAMDLAAPGAGAPGSEATGAGAPGSEATGATGLAARSDAAGSLATFAARRSASDAVAAEPGETDVLGAAAAFVPAARRARFDALYVALSQSSEGRSWSPAARAARALALAGRGEGSTVSARERAASAWDVLPVVYPNVAGAVDSPELAASGAAPSAAASAAALMSSYISLASPARGGASTSSSSSSSSSRAGARASAGRASTGRAQRAGGRDVVAGGYADVGDDMIQVNAPGLSGLSARAGDALGSYVSAVSPPAAPSERGAVLRAPSAAPEYVKTGRTGGRYGGGEVEIPPWFEAAARRMLAERSGDSDGISFAELTLVTAAPASHVAASSVQAAAPSPTNSGATTTAQGANSPKIDVDKIANELFHDIMMMMDVARSRNGDPYQ